MRPSTVHGLVCGLGFREVKLVYRRTRAEMPAISQEIREAANEGVEFIFLALPTEF